ncbi:hypothetical protein SAMN05519104_7972 [Rhizobiales bacterium GAS188]|nr:hypothetical protein SAMN05519104_7972 [Rhizobiales bacterium GAS188]
MLRLALLKTPSTLDIGLIRRGRYGRHPPFFLVAFSRTEASELRADTAMKALNEQHAECLASHLVGNRGGAVAFSQMGDPSAAEIGDTKILARYGDVPDDRTLLPGFGDVRASGCPGVMGAPAHPLARPIRVPQSLESVLSRLMPFTAEWKRGPRQGRKYSLAIASLVAVAIAASGSGMLVITASAAHCKARLVEMAGPACDHTGTTNEELHRLVRHEYRVGASKKEAFARSSHFAWPSPGRGELGACSLAELVPSLEVKHGLVRVSGARPPDQGAGGASSPATRVVPAWSTAGAGLAPSARLLGAPMVPHDGWQIGR